MTARWHTRSVGLDLKWFAPLVAWVLIPGFLVSHFVVLLLYHPEHLRFDWGLVNVGRGMSSFGGFFGGALGAIVYLQRRRLPVLAYIDALVLGLVVGWFFGRLGCTIVHDHPGLPSDFILAVEYPSGARHDLGFYEWLFTIALIVLLFVIRRRGYPAGVLTGITCVAYAPVRFMLDFLRVGDERFYGLTPGQYFALVLMVVGGWVLVRAVRPPRRRGS